MANGDGSIRQEKGKDGKPIPNCWRVTVSLGTDGQGRRKRKTKIVRGSKTEARKARDKMVREASGGIDLMEGDKVTVAQLFERWLPIAGRSMEKSSLVNITRKAGAICGVAGSWKVKDVTPVDCYALMEELVRAKEAAGHPIGANTQGAYIQLLRRAFGFAVECGLATRNPAESVRPPRRTQPERRSLSKAEAVRLRETLERQTKEAVADYVRRKEAREASGKEVKCRVGLAEISNLMAVRLCLATGMRRGEVFGLPWKCVDFERGTVTVAQSIDRDRRLKKPKTKAGERTISVDEATMSALHEWDLLQASEMMEAGVPRDGESPVFTSNVFTWVCATPLDRWWFSWRDKNGFPGLKLHELRHTQATMLLANGVDLKTVQTRLGHRDASVTLNTYAHAVKENDKAAGDLIGDLFSGQGSKVVSFKTA